MPKLHRLLRPSSHGRASDLLFEHPLGEALHRLPKIVFTHDKEYGGNDLSFKTIHSESDLGTVGKPDVAALLEAAVPSPFGKGEETVFDEAVRRGKELNAETLTVSDKYGSFFNCIKRKITKELFPHTKGVSLRFYKLAIYEAGGHFAFHRDTTHADEHHATLLVEVKSAHKGGRLIFEVDGEEVPGIDFSASDKKKIAWIAFYTDVRHKVEPITEGVRIVLQYDVLVGAQQDKKKKKNEEEEEDEEPFLEHNRAIDEATSANESQLAHVLSALEQAFASQQAAVSKVTDDNDEEKEHPRTLSLPLFHLYRTASIRPKYLKSVDRELFFAVLKTGLYDVALSPILIHFESFFERGNRNTDEEYGAVLTDPVDKIYTEVDEDGRAISVSVDGDHVFNTCTAQYIVSNREPTHVLEHTDFIEYTGNEAQPARYKYFLGAMLISKKE